MTPVVAVLYTEFPNLDLEERVLAPLGAKVKMVRALDADGGQATVDECDALMVTTQRVDAEMLGRLKHCKIISRVGTGLDAIDLNAAAERGIWVTNVPDYSIDEVSTHALAMVMAHTRGLPALFEQAGDKVWNPLTVRPRRRLSEQTLGIVGFGRIARAVANKGQALKLRVIAYDPYVDASVIRAAGVTPVDLDTLLKESDYVSLHVPLTPETRHMINADALAKMKSTAFLINAARGPLVDVAALVEATDRGKLAGAALDVFETEPLPSDSPLFRNPKIWVTPHVAWYSEDAKVDSRVRGAEEVARVLGGQPPRNPANKIKV